MAKSAIPPTGFEPRCRDVHSGGELGPETRQPDPGERIGLLRKRTPDGTRTRATAMNTAAACCTQTVQDDNSPVRGTGLLGSTPDGIRTRATALRGRRARPLHNGGVERTRLYRTCRSATKSVA